MQLNQNRVTLVVSGQVRSVIRG